MSSIILPNGEPAINREPAPENAVKYFTEEQWQVIVDKLRRAELYRIALATLVSDRANNKMKIKISHLENTERKNLGLAFENDEKNEYMVFHTEESIPPFSVN